MRHLADLTTLLAGDSLRAEALAAVQSLALSDGWIGAGFVRDAVWDYLHGYVGSSIAGDVDVVWFDTERSSASIDQEIERQLRGRASMFNWSVKNQARMHLRNGDDAYDSVAGAMRNWPETATAVAVRLGHGGGLEVNAPFGLDDLFALRLRPTRKFTAERRPIFQQRLIEKRWIERYPLLNITRA